MVKKIFVTGAAGFIGFHLALALKKRGDFVIGCDNFNDYYDPELKINRASILGQYDIPCLQRDIRDASEIEKIVRENDITHFVHLAAQAGVRYSLEHPEKYVDANLDGFVKILEACRRHPGIRCIYASSSSVYGLNTKLPFSEEDATDSPASLYGATKKANEVIAHSYHHLYGIPLIGLRFFTVYGPWGRPDMAYYSFTRSIINGVPIPVYGEGLLRRDFTYIDDIISGIIAAIDYVKTDYEIFNLGNNKPSSVLELISCIEEATQKKALLDFQPLQPGDVHTTFASIAKSQSLLHFHPKTSLQEGIRKFVDWYLENFSEPIETCRGDALRQPPPLAP